MSKITVTSFKDYKDKSEGLELIPLPHGSRNLNHWDVIRWWYKGRKIYEACARVNNTENGDVLYIASSTNYPYLKIEFDAGTYTFDSDHKRAHIDRILIKTASEDIDVQIPLRGPIAPVTVSVPTQPLAVASGQGANWLGSNVYEVGKTVEGRTAAYTGGAEPVTYRYRFQFKATGSDSWVNEPWVTTTNAKNSVTYTLTETGQIKLQSQARDSSDPVGQLNSITGIKNVNGIGDITATVFDNPYDLVAAPPLTVLTEDPIAVAVQKSGSANVTYSWTIRSPAAAEFSNPIGASTDVTIATVGVATVQCTIQSLGEIKTITIQFFGVATRAELEALQE